MGTHESPICERDRRPRLASGNAGNVAARSSVRQDASWWDSMTLAPPAGFRKRYAVSRIGALFRSGSAIRLTLFHENSISCQRMNVSMKHTRSAHEVGAEWTIADASELYEIDRWGKGYFTIGDNGQVR